MGETFTVRSSKVSRVNSFFNGSGKLTSSMRYLSYLYVLRNVFVLT